MPNCPRRRQWKTRWDKQKEKPDPSLLAVRFVGEDLEHGQLLKRDGLLATGIPCCLLPESGIAIVAGRIDGHDSLMCRNRISTRFAGEECLRKTAIDAGIGVPKVDRSENGNGTGCAGVAFIMALNQFRELPERKALHGHKRTRCLNEMREGLNGTPDDFGFRVGAAVLRDSDGMSLGDDHVFLHSELVRLLEQAVVLDGG